MLSKLKLKLNYRLYILLYYNKPYNIILKNSLNNL